MRWEVEKGQDKGSFPYQAVDVYSRGPILTVCRAPWAAWPSGVKGSGPAAGEGQGQEEVGGTGGREGSSFAILLSEFCGHTSVSLLQH